MQWEENAIKNIKITIASSQINYRAALRATCAVQCMTHDFSQQFLTNNIYTRL